MTDRHFWTALHAFVAAHWGYFLAATIFELVEHGGLNRSPIDAPQFSPAFTVYFVTLMLATTASAVRALWLEPRS